MEALRDWCAQHVAAAPGTALGLESVAGDASFRRYYRLTGTAPTRIAVHAPPEKERNLEFTQIAALLRAAGVQAPEVLAHDQDRGFLLLSDFGDRLLLGALDPHSAAALYAQALDTLLAIQQAATATSGWQVPPYDEALLRQEMNLFPEWYLGGLLQVPLDQAARALLAQLFGTLVQEALQQPQVLVHRDYHSRNLMLLDDGTLGVIDFQDAVRGPVTYDLVSLLRDCYVAWPEERVRGWALDYARRAAQAGIIAPVEPERFLRWFDLMGLQRHLKVLGIFARLWLRDAKSGYLRDLPLVMRYTVSVAARYPETRPFAEWFAQAVQPLAARQDWYRDR